MFDDKCLVVGITGQQISNWLSDGSPFRIRVGLRASCAYFRAAPMRFNVFNIDIDLILIRRDCGRRQSPPPHDGDLNRR